MAEQEFNVNVFISYSQSRRDLTESLAAVLEAAGFSTWWDTDLVAGDNFRDEIDKQIEACKAVIIIWTQESAQSVWVKSEASHALRLKKLVNLCVPELKSDNIPKPFGEFHSVVIDNRAAIIGAVKQRVERYKIGTGGSAKGTDTLPPAKIESSKPDVDPLLGKNPASWSRPRLKIWGISVGGVFYGFVSGVIAKPFAALAGALLVAATTGSSYLAITRGMIPQIAAERHLSNTRTGSDRTDAETGVISLSSGSPNSDARNNRTGGNHPA